jgi:hypothetical protein
LGYLEPDETGPCNPGVEHGHRIPATAKRLHLLPGRRLRSNLPKGHHTDRGSQYCSHDYQKILRKHGFKVSMSGKGNCYDNAAVETFFKTIKAELIWRHPWGMRRQAEMSIAECINGFDNPRRRHSALRWKRPVAFERKVAETSTWGGTKARQAQSACKSGGTSSCVLMIRVQDKDFVCSVVRQAGNPIAWRCLK